MNLNALIRGQSNALMMIESNGWAGYGEIIRKVEALLGFDGVHDTVSLEYSSSNASGANTVNSGTAFLTDWLSAKGGDWHNGWQTGGLEQGLLNYVNALPAAQKADPTAVVWLHSEYDSKDWSLTPDQWESAVRYDASLVRAAFGKSAADLPYLFVSAIPYWGTDQGHQAIRIGMEELAADRSFNGGIAARALDVDMSHDDTDGNPQTVEYGGPHMSDADGIQTADRIALALAQQWAEYAKPGSPVALAGGNVDDLGPQVVQATPVGSNQLSLKVSFDAASSLASLDAVAAQGVGWSVHAGGTTLHGTAAEVIGPDTLLVTFDGAVPADGLLYYGYGYGRLVGADGSGQGHAVYDNNGMPIWVDAHGLAIGGAAATPAPAPTPAPTPVPATPSSPATDGQASADPAPAPFGPIDWNALAAQVMANHAATGEWYVPSSAPAPAPTPSPAPAPTPTPAPVSQEIGSGADVLVLKISQDAWQGDAQYTVSVDGMQVGGTFTASASHVAGQSDTLTLHGDWAPGSHTVTVNFLNDAWGGTADTDRNLHVDAIAFGGQAVAGSSADLMQAGPVDFAFIKAAAAAPAPVADPAPATEAVIDWNALAAQVMANHAASGGWWM